MKGCILSRFSGARIIDLTHEIVVHWPAEAGFWLARAFQYFPAGTVHVAVVDPGVGTSRDIVAVTARGHLFLAPDNGLLAPIVRSEEHTSELQSQSNLVCRLLLEKKKKYTNTHSST